MGLLKNLFRFFGIFILLWIMYTKISIKHILDILHNINYIYLILAFILMTLMIIVKYARIFLNIKGLGIDIHPVKLFKIYINSLILGQITTQAVSTISAAAATIVSSGGKKKIRIGNIYILNNILDLVFALLIMLICILLNKNILEIIEFKSTNNYMILLAAVLIIFVIAGFVFKNKISKKIRYVLEEVFESSRLSLKSSLFMTLFVWTVYTASCFAEIRIFHITLPLSLTVFVYIAGSIITAIPISFSGVGTRDLAFIYLLGFSGVEPEKAFLLSFFSYIVNPLSALGFLYVTTFLLKENR